MCAWECKSGYQAVEQIKVNNSSSKFSGVSRDYYTVVYPIQRMPSAAALNLIASMSIRSDKGDKGEDIERRRRC